MSKIKQSSLYSKPYLAQGNPNPERAQAALNCCQSYKNKVLTGKRDLRTLFFLVEFRPMLSKKKLTLLMGLYPRKLWKDLGKVEGGRKEPW